MDEKKYSILVTGGAGYIGSHVVLELCDKGHSVTVLDNLSTGNKGNIDKRAKFINGSILNPLDLKNTFKNHFDIVFHFIALKAAGESMVSPSQYAKININGTINLLDQMENNRVEYIIFSSSAAVYGAPKYLPIDENHSLDPINFYGFTKLEIERVLYWYSKLKGMKFAVLRYFNAAGYDVKNRIVIVEKNIDNLMPIIMETASGIRESMKVFGNNYKTKDGTCIRDYIHVSDLASAHIKSMNYIVKNNLNITLNLATGKGYSVLDIISAAKEITGKNILYDIVDRRKGDPSIVISKSNLAKKIINWIPKYSKIENILESNWNVYK